MRRVLLFLALIGCGSGVSLSTDRAQYALGDEVVLHLANGSGRSVGYNLCGVWLERQTDAAWATVPSSRVCPASLLKLEVLGHAASTERLEGGLAKGTYRFVTDVEGEGWVRSNAFDVR